MPKFTFKSPGLHDLELEAATKEEATEIAKQIYQQAREEKYMPTITIGLSGDEAITKLIPEHCQAGLRLYLSDGIMPGSFLTAVLENDFVGAFSKADSINELRLRDYAKFLHDWAPRGCWGSRVKVIAWCEGGGLKGMEQRAQTA